jgi:ADP-heptose:LPS heptosyltransferase/glycosyltransferase involved in cell wall biosynthesis
VKKILIVGEHPISTSGNGGMMHSILSDIDYEKYEVTCFALESTPAEPHALFNKSFPFSLIPAMQQHDRFGHEKLSKILKWSDIDILITLGIDIWEYYNMLDGINRFVKNKGIKWISIFPYDLQTVRDDWVNWIKMYDYPCVYSQYGYDILEDHIPNIRYFRPPLQGSDVWRRFGDKERLENRRKYFPFATDDTFMFGYVGANQVRKDPQKVVKAFSIVKNELSDRDIRLYLHCGLDDPYNLKQYSIDCGLNKSDLFAREQSSKSTIEGIVKVYNSIDCLVNSSLQEGLSWTLIEAMLCGTPFIASYTTAQKEILDKVGIPVKCEEHTYMPLAGIRGPSFIDAKCCVAEDLAEAMIEIVSNDSKRKEMSIKGLEVGKEWLAGVSDINVLLEEACFDEGLKVSPVIDSVLFAQHSSAGDVLMTTQCFKGIKEKHPNLSLIYMTQEIYMNIVERNPYLDEIIPWDESKLKRKYKVVYNPHGEKILPGRFNTLDTKLYSMYPYFCKVDPDDMFIYTGDTDPKVMKMINGLGNFVVVHTSGGAKSRIYKHMNLVVKDIKDYKIVQVGAGEDLACQEVDLDLRGKLSWREAAYVMSKAKVSVVIDSYLAHLAGAVYTPSVILFGPAPSRVVGPRSDKVKMICIEPNHLDVCPQMGFCYGGECSSPCINTISPTKVRKELLSLLAEA